MQRSFLMQKFKLNYNLFHRMKNKRFFGILVLGGHKCKDQ